MLVAVIVVWMPCTRDRDGQPVVLTARTALERSHSLLRETVSLFLRSRSVD